MPMLCMLEMVELRSAPVGISTPLLRVGAARFAARAAIAGGLAHELNPGDEVRCPFGVRNCARPRGRPRRQQPMATDGLRAGSDAMRPQRAVRCSPPYKEACLRLPSHELAGCPQRVGSANAAARRVA